ncbi:unnamed protein product [Oikopleura dioica]|uniref:C3H1-type domain-containing protein n=1 Tax=Oikopleura dioica TaxID=34765 RepID=E4Z1G4_OIKDI|nr:unnamed protein product [Oikopleura dioica]
MSRDQATALKSAENALIDVNYSGHDFEETSNFTARVNQVYDIYIRNDSDLEESFAAKVKQRFKPIIYSRLKDASVSTKTWKELQLWLNKEYDSGLSATQLLTRAMETPFDSDAGWKKYSQSISDRMEAAKHSILSQIRKTKMEKYKTTKLEDKKNEPVAEDIFSFVCASIVAGRLKVEKPEIHSMMANEWSKISDGATVATKIEFLQAQTNKEGGSVFFAQKGNKNWNGNKTGTNGGRGKSRKLCWNFAKGNCKKGDDCGFRHAKAENQESKVHVAKDPDLPDEPVSTLIHSVLM